MMKKITTWIKVENVFILQDNIRSVSRYGKGSKISLIQGDDVFTKISFDELNEILPLQK